MPDSKSLDPQILRTSSSEENTEKIDDSGGIDSLFARSTQLLADRTFSRRSFLAWVAKLALAIAGAELVRILPLDREVQIAKAEAGNCNAWYMCGIYAARVCSCACGSNNCPTQAGCTTQQRLYWTACCYNGFNHYVVRYYDCCSQPGACRPSCCSVSNCQCFRVQQDDIWCSGWTLCCTKVDIITTC